MLTHAGDGEMLDLLSGHPAPDPPDARTWTSRQTIRADVLRHLLTRDEWPVEARGVRLRGVRISGLLDLEAAALRCPLRLEDCYFDDPRPVTLSFAHAPWLVFTRCWLPGFAGGSVTVAADLQIDGCVVGGPVVLSGARIGGALMLGGSQIGANRDGNGLVGQGMSVRLSVFLGRGFVSEGAHYVPRAEIGGQLHCQGARLGANGGANSLDGQGMTVGGSVYLDGGFTTTGVVRLSGASIRGQLRCQGAQLGANEEGNSLVGDVLRVDGSVAFDAFRDGTVFTAQGAIRLMDADIKGSLTCQDASLGANDFRNSLDCRGVRVGGSAYLDGRFIAQGAVWLAGASVVGQLRCGGARIGANAFGNAFIADGLRAHGGLVLDRFPDGTAFTAQGAVRLTGADITGSFTCAGAQLSANKRGNALEGDEINVSVAVFLDSGFNSTGAIRLSGAVIGGQFRCRDAQFDGADHDGDSLVCGGAKIGGTVFLDGHFSAAGGIRFSGAEIGGSLLMQGAVVGANEEGRALDGQGMTVGRDILLSRTRDGRAFQAAGAIVLATTAITGSFRCQGADLGSDSEGESLNCTGAQIGGSVFLSNGFTSAGAVRLARAEITGSLACGGARLGANNDLNALIGDGMKVGHDVTLNKDRDGNRFTAAGAVRLIGADISGQISCNGADLRSGDAAGDALVCNGVKVGGSLYLDAGFSSEGAVKLTRAHIAGSLNCRGASLGRNTESLALIAERVNIGPYRDWCTLGLV